jgi:hypothetical protein
MIQRDLPCPVPFTKRFRLTRRANQNYKPRRLVLKRGALAIVTNVGTGCGGRGSVGVRSISQGGFPVSGIACARRRRQSVRQNRVVLAPVAGVKSAEVLVSPTGRDKTFNSPMTVARRIRRRGERGISRKTIVRGMPECSDCTCMLVCASYVHFAHETAGAARTRHSLRPLACGRNDLQSPGETRRGNAEVCLIDASAGGGWPNRTNSRRDDRKSGGLLQKSLRSFCP